MMVLLRRAFGYWRYVLCAAAFFALIKEPLMDFWPQGSAAGLQPRNIFVLNSDELKEIGGGKHPTWGGFLEQFHLDRNMVRASMEATRNDADQTSEPLSWPEYERRLKEPVGGLEGRAIFVMDGK